MYKEFFGFVEAPFSIVANSRYLFLSQRHREAITHLQAGLGEGGGFAMLTGEVGTGKTTVAKAMLDSLDTQTKAGFILNPTFSGIELLESICDEFSIKYPSQATLKQLNQAIYQYLLSNHAEGFQTLLVIDEAQHLAADVLEQLRLLTNLETDSRKLLKVLLVGQPELQQKLQMPQLRQLAQRITGRYHLLPLDGVETAKYVHFRLSLAGGRDDLFPAKALKMIAHSTQGIPRLVNLVCDATLKQAYQQGEREISLPLVQRACDEVMAFQTSSVAMQPARKTSWWLSSGVAISASLALGVISSIALTTLSKPSLDAFALQYWSGKLPTPPAVETRAEVFAPELKQTLLNDALLESSIDKLYQVWGYNASVLDSFCSAQTREDALFRCEKAEGDLQRLAQLNQPVVLSLDIDGVMAYAVLYKLSDDNVTLLTGGKQIEFDKRWLSTIWHGEYRFIWQPSFDRTLRAGMSGIQVAELDKKLSKLLGESVGNSSEFDAQLRRKVETFQQWQGMTVDGIAGRQTLKAIDLMSQENAPSLLNVTVFDEEEQG
ncbi:ExeA family protein [Vibrio paucivorans]|uniref:AAA family ATPase n=1 Tax=Vibrio paucivorans TaxID=2829489 RepID=A0A9X3CEL6_9VIBR|nr:ExeA family protein [Vibrio paucivorans]MCW8334397.1 AAA family ATPase [Vibrio paucivorans]